MDLVIKIHLTLLFRVDFPGKMKNRQRSEISASDESDEGTNLHSSNNVNSSSYKKNSMSPQKKVVPNLVDKFLSDNENLSKIDINDVISEDDDVAVLEVPKTIDGTLFLDKLVELDTKTKLKLDHNKYIVEPEFENIKPINLLTNKLKIIHPISILKIREYKKHKRQSEVVDSNPSPPVLPENLKVRHPLFGAEFKRKIVLSEEIQQKLDNALEKAVEKMKKKKAKVKHEEGVTQELSEPPVKVKRKKKHHAAENGFFESDPATSQKDTQDESIFSLLETHIKNKKNQSLQEEDDISASINQSSQDVQGSFEEKKKKRKSNVKVETITSEDPADSMDGKKRKHKNNNLAAQFMETLDDKSKIKNKHLVNIKKEVFSQDENDEFDDVVSQDKIKHRRNSIKQEKLYRRNSIINSTVIPDLQLPMFEFDVSGIVNKEEHDFNENEGDTSGTGSKSSKKQNKSVEYEKQQKKKIKQEQLESNDNSDVKPKKRKLDSALEDETTSPKKKQKKIKQEPEEPTDSLILNLLNRVKSEMGSSTKPKKRKSEN